jgi:hypothetical protein
MGARLYNPNTGRFLSIDPTTGGNATAYNYPTDPIDFFDLNGHFQWRKWIKRAVTAAGVIGAAACIVASAGICGGVALAVGALSIASDGYGYAHHEMNGRQFAQNTAFNLATMFLPGARSVRLGGLHSAVRAAAGGRDLAKGAKANLSLLKAFKFQPIRAALRVTANLYIGYHSATGRWGF